MTLPRVTTGTDDTVTDDTVTNDTVINYTITNDTVQMTVTNDSDFQVSLVPLDHRVPLDHQEAKDQPDRKGDKEAQEAAVPQDRLVFREQPGSVGDWIHRFARCNWKSWTTGGHR